MLTCREIADFLSAYHEGELPPAQRAEFDRHLAVCGPCVTYLQGYQHTIKLCTALGNEAHTADQHAEIPAELVKAILAARASDKGQ